MAGKCSSGGSVDDEIEAFYDFLDRQTEVDGPDPCRIERAIESVRPMDDGTLVVQSTLTGRLRTREGAFIGAPAIEQHRDRWRRTDDGRWAIVSAEKRPLSAATG